MDMWATTWSLIFSLNKIISKQLPFYPSVQHVLNCNTMLMCDECGMGYSTKPGEIRRLKQSFGDVVQVYRKLILHAREGGLGQRLPPAGGVE